MKRRIPVKERHAQRSKALEHRFAAATGGLLSKLRGTEGFEHRLSKGLQRERALITELFANTFPRRFDFVSGEIHDSHGSASSQLDVVVYNALNHFVFLSDLYSILPAEAALCCIEVKSKLDKNALRDSLLAASKVKSLEPFGLRSTGPRVKGKAADDGKARYMYCLFAFTSSNEGEDWGAKTLGALRDIASEEGLDDGAVDRIYSIGQGMLIPKDSTGEGVWFPERQEDGNGLLRLYQDILNFCEREDRRRPYADIVNYMGKPSGKPTKYKPTR